MNFNSRKRDMSSDDFRRLAERIGKYVDFRGCATEKCINKRIKSIKSSKLNNLIKNGFASRLLLESWLNPHPIYKKILDISDKDYNMLLDEKSQSDRRLKGLR